MSLIVARKDSKGLYIVSDTKLTSPDNWEFSERQKNNPKEGAIKTVIIGNQYCISFAGNIDYADQVLQKINITHNTADIIQMLLKQHNLSEQATDFIFCVGISDPLIYEIKNGSVAPVISSWIGSQAAFNKFQTCMLGTNEAISQTSFISIAEATGTDLFQKMSTAIDSVIQDETIPEVAGFKIRVHFDGKRFNYMGYLDSYFSNKTIVLDMSKTFHIPLTHANAADGGYTINFFNSKTDFNYVGLHIKQGNFGIVYSKKDEGLLYPVLFENIDELDFLDFVKEKFKISPSGVTQDAVAKFGISGDSYYKNNQFEEACNCYSKGIHHLSGKEKARFYFNKAICLVQLQRLPEAMISFNDAVKLDSSYMVNAINIMKGAVLASY